MALATSLMADNQMLNGLKVSAPPPSLQLPQQMLINHVKQVSLVDRAADPVRFAGIHHKAELLARFNEAFDHLNAVLEMDIVVTGAVDQQQRSTQFSGHIRQAQILIALPILFRKSLITLGINRIVVSPIGDR